MNNDRIPDVSVIVPAYNVEKYINECLDSIKFQTLRNYEVIIINDGSTDNTEAVIRRFIEKDYRFKIFNQKNKGPGFSRNRGITIAKGQFIYFLDSDDSIEPDMLERCVNLAKKNDLDMVHINGSVFSEIEFDNGSIKKGNYIRDLPEFPENFYKHAISSKQYRCPVWLYLVRTEFLKTTGISFVSGILHEDEGFTLKLVNSTKKQGFLKNILVNRRIRPNSIMTTVKSIENATGYFETFCDLAKWHPHCKLAFPENATLIKRHIAMIYTISMRSFLKIRETKKLKKIYWKNLCIILNYAPIKHALAPIFPKRIADKLIT